MKTLIKIAIGAVAVCAFASASAGVIIKSSADAGKKSITMVYQQSPTGVLQSITIKQKKLARWCKKNGGCSQSSSIVAAQVPMPLGVEAPAVQPVAVPEPATLALLGAGLLGMGIAARRRKVTSA